MTTNNKQQNKLTLSECIKYAITLRKAQHILHTMLKKGDVQIRGVAFWSLGDTHLRMAIGALEEIAKQNGWEMTN
jgi:hypothetical protein